MLKELHIKNVILIKDISIYFNKGFSVFTGETGAGKSILLDSLSLSLGERANFSFIRKGAERGEIIAIFENIHQDIKNILKDNFIDLEEELILRRIVSIDGRSKAFINNIPVSVGFLRNIGLMLLDIHGQFDNHRLINPSFHREIIDSFISDKSIFQAVKKSYLEYKEVSDNFNKKQEEIQKLIQEQEYLEYVVKELQEIDPKEHEEKDLLEKKQLLNNSKRIRLQVDKISNLLEKEGALSSLNSSLNQVIELQKLLDNNSISRNLQENIESSYNFLYEALENLKEIREDIGEIKDLEAIEERLMNLRVLAKKHRVQIDDLPKLKEDLEEKLFMISQGENFLNNLQEHLEEKYKNYQEQANKLTLIRKETATKLDTRVNQELDFLKLQGASFRTSLEETNESIYGNDKIIFMVQTNKGSDFGYLNKIASGGEMARFMLALKIVLSEVDIINTIILDEIDIGVGGEVAEAIGKRLLYLSDNIQTIIVTHSHQVASKGDYHYKVVKKEIGEESTESEIYLLDEGQRVDEVARMLSGSQITSEARATAINLLNNKDN